MMARPGVDQGSLNVLIGLFRRVSLMGNVAKSNTMTFQLGGDYHRDVIGVFQL